MKAHNLRKYHENFLKKYHGYDHEDEYRGFGKKRYDSDDESSRRRLHRRSSRFGSDDEDEEEDHHIRRSHKKHRGHGDLGDLDDLDRKVEGIERRLRGSLNQEEGETDS